jgi:hypothetical protein
VSRQPPPAGEQQHTMKAVVYGRYGSPDVLELTGIDQAVVGDDQVLVRVAWSAQRRRVPSGPAVADAKERLSVTGVKLPWRAGHVNSCVSGREPVENVGRTGVRFAFGAHTHRLLPPGSLAGVPTCRPGVEALVARRHWCCVRCSACPPGPSWPARPGIGVWSRAPADLRQLPDAGSRSGRRKVNCQLFHRRVLFGSDGESV